MRRDETEARNRGELLLEVLEPLGLTSHEVRVFVTVELLAVSASALEKRMAVETLDAFQRVLEEFRGAIREAAKESEAN